MASLKKMEILVHLGYIFEILRMPDLLKDLFLEWWKILSRATHSTSAWHIPKETVDQLIHIQVKVTEQKGTIVPFYNCLLKALSLTSFI